MGWFGRRSTGSGDEFYTGDAPVLMPGVDGDAPSAYVSGGPWPTGTPVPDASWTAQPGAFAGWQGDSAGDGGQPPPSGTAAGGVAAAFGDSAPPGYPPPPGYPAPPGYPPSPGYHGPPQYGVPGAAERTVRRVGLGCFAVVAILVLLGIAGVAFAVFGAFRASIPGLGDPAPDTVIGTVDVPVTVRYDDTDVSITVGGAQGQPGGGWGRSPATTPPNLVIAASLRQSGGSTVTIPFIDWSFAPADGSAPVTLNIVSGFDPAIVTASLPAGETEIGYLVFETPATAGTLTLQGGYGDPPLASWDLTGSSAGVITGSLGVPARGQVGMPPFTVTLDAITWIDPTSAAVWQPPTSGSYLVADLTVTATGQSSSGIIDHELFVFVPAGGQPVGSSPPGQVQDTTSITSVSGGGNAAVRLAFDVAQRPGTLELRDTAGRTIIGWPVG